MHFKNQEFQINPKNPFEFDCLDRKKTITNLSKILAQTDGGFVLSIESNWGSGKTTFINMWKAVLENGDYICLYFNAWDSDFSEDPLLTFIDEMKDLAKTEVFKKADEDIIDVLENLPSLGGKILRKSIPVALEIITQRILDKKTVDEILSGKISSFISQVAEERINLYESEKNSIYKFKKSLSYLVKNLRIQKFKTPIIFFIDELDRCRPDYAISLLERIKHIFNLDGFVFVLSLDRRQIENSIRFYYGNDIDTDGYLRKFIDLSYSLPNPSKSAFCKYLVNKMGFSDFFSSRKDTRDYLSELIEATIKYTDLYDMSLRKIEQCFGRLAVALSLIVLGDPIYIYQLVFLVFTQAINDEIYNQIFSKNIKMRKLLEFFQKFPKFNSDYLRMYYVTVEPFVAFYIFNEEQLENYIESVRNDLASINIDASTKRLHEIRMNRFERLSNDHVAFCFNQLFQNINFSLDT